MHHLNKKTKEKYKPNHQQIGLPPNSALPIPVAQDSKEMPAMQETLVPFLGGEDPLEEEIAAHSSILAWGIPWTESLVGCSPWGCKSWTRLSN